MKNPTTTQPAIPTEPQDERAEWITPAITDYDIEEATLNSFSTTAHGDASFSTYS
jgi:hypothetical protein